jgi:hypothetical protein
MKKKEAANYPPFMRKRKDWDHTVAKSEQEPSGPVVCSGKVVPGRKPAQMWMSGYCPNLIFSPQRHREAQPLGEPFTFWFLQVQGFLRDSVVKIRTLHAPVTK